MSFAETCKRNEFRLYPFVKAGVLEIDEVGRVWRVKIGRWYFPTEEVVFFDCKRRRAERENHRGYLILQARIDKIIVQAMAHRVVYLHFAGEIPENLTINHVNGQKQDNRLENLELATMSEQALHAVRVLKVGRAADQDGEKHWNCRLTNDQVREIRQRGLEKEPYSSIAHDFPIKASQVRRICKRLSWSHI